MLDILIEPFTYDFFLKAMLIATLVGIMCSLLSCFLILKGWSLLGDALSHAVIPGVVISFINKIPYFIGILASAILAVLTILFVRNKTKEDEASVLTLVTTFFMGIGFLIYSLKPGLLRIYEIILGRIVSLSNLDMIQITIMITLVIIVISLIWKKITILLFDNVQAKILGINKNLYMSIFFILVCLAIVSSIRSVGSILVISMLITPGVSAYLLTDKMSKMLIISSIFGGLTGLIGSYLSFLTDTTTGAFIVVIQAILFFFILLFAPKYGVISIKIKNRKEQIILKERNNKRKLKELTNE